MVNYVATNRTAQWSPFSQVTDGRRLLVFFYHVLHAGSHA